MEHHHDHKKFLESSLTVLREKKLKVTRPRKLLLELLIEEHGPFTTEELHRKLNTRDKTLKCDLVTVYRSLSSFEAIGLVSPCQFGDNSVRYEFRSPSGEHHHHVICRKCRKVETLDGCFLGNAAKTLSKKGYTDLSHVLEVFGICPACRKK